MPALGFDDSLFNIEFFVHADGTAKIVEVNGRMASQFAPLVRAVHGMSSYRIQLELVTGGKPHLPKPRTDMVASSFVLRRYMADGIVESVPDPAAVVERFPGSQVELLVRPGQRLSDNDDDSASHRLAVVAMSGPDRAHASSATGRRRSASWPSTSGRSSVPTEPPPLADPAYAYAS